MQSVVGLICNYRSGAPQISAYIDTDGYGGFTDSNLQMNYLRLQELKTAKEIGIGLHVRPNLMKTAEI